MNNHNEKILKSRVIVLCSAISYIFLRCYFDYDDATASAAIVALLTADMLSRGKRNSLEMALDVSYFYVMLPPTILNLFFDEGQYTFFLCIYYVFQNTFLFLYEKNKNIHDFVKELPPSKSDRQIWLFLIAATSVLSVATQGSNNDDGSVTIFAFSLPYGASLVYFERVISNQKWKTSLLIQVIPVFLYAFFIWSGFGRLLIGAYMIMPILILNRHHDLGIKSAYWALVSPIALITALFSRLKTTDFEKMTDDSGVSHLILTQEMLLTVHHRVPAGLSEYVQQWMLLFLAWIPRDLWTSKPLGIGFSFVSDWMGSKAAYQAGFSVAIGFIGENLWYLGDMAFAGLAFHLATLILIRKMIERFASGRYAPLAGFDAMLPTYIWGGAAAFGSRIWFFVIPMIAVTYLTSQSRRNPRLSQ